MVNIITDLAKYVMIILLAVFTLLGFRLVRGPEEKNAPLSGYRIFSCLRCISQGTQCCS